ncbi:MAG: hypothetical protein CMO61_12095 [Verrucomicrobiales bacterium]|jgi:3-hydroxymyristoyl/3-hydroxydecanoyl-(acyl carrier protein) dehydratase|nr:hypothetical protein [Verrucomicrobiales bacterium]|tara:strand:- start:55093 stop:55917 length:825 start_codon:yes stop_codon:yes gene_type:complete
MSDHFRAFSFVDRILSDKQGKAIVGQYQIPDLIRKFPMSLVAESIGQCAAMSSMAAVNFKHRPVAGIASVVEFCGCARPGDILKLEVSLTRADEEAVAYSGVAWVGDKPVAKLSNCLGPMVLMEDFDNPVAVRKRYQLLVDSGAEPDAFGGVESVDFESVEKSDGEREGQFTVPHEAAFFGDHFPRRPVFPGTLLMDLKLKFVADLIVDLEGGPWTVVGMQDVKLRSFMPPGELLELSGKVDKIDGEQASILVQSRKGKRRNSSARVMLEKKIL